MIPNIDPSPVRRLHCSRGFLFMLSATSDAIGDFELPQAPIGVYRLQVSAPGFATVIDAITIASGTYPLLHVRLDSKPPCNR